MHGRLRLQKEKNMKPTREELELMMERGEDVSQYMGKSTLRPGKKAPGLADIVRVNVDFTGQVLAELDSLATLMNISRQAVIKMLLRQSLDMHYVANRKQTA